jgi:hypothetical protein
MNCSLVALLDLQDLLATENDQSGNPLDMPRALILQFDNCSENKVMHYNITYTIFM